MTNYGSFDGLGLQDHLLRDKKIHSQLMVSLKTQQKKSLTSVDERPSNK